MGDPTEGAVAERPRDLLVSMPDRLTSSPNPVREFSGLGVGTMVQTGVPDKPDKLDSIVMFAEEEVLLIEGDGLLV